MKKIEISLPEAKKRKMVNFRLDEAIYNRAKTRLKAHGIKIRVYVEAALQLAATGRWKD